MIIKISHMQIRSSRMMLFLLAFLISNSLFGQQYEVLDETNWVRRTLSRDGAFAWARCRINRSWDLGTYYENFESSRGANHRRRRLAGFLTWNASHYQKICVEYVRDDRGDFEETVDQIILQFDGVIGFHTHGRQR